MRLGVLTRHTDTRTHTNARTHTHARTCSRFNLIAYQYKKLKGINCIRTRMYVMSSQHDQPQLFDRKRLIKDKSAGNPFSYRNKVYQSHIIITWYRLQITRGSWRTPEIRFGTKIQNSNLVRARTQIRQIAKQFCGGAQSGQSSWFFFCIVHLFFQNQTDRTCYFERE